MLSRRSITLLLIGSVVSEFVVVNVSGEPFESQNDDHYDSSPNFVPVKDRIKGINSHTKNNDFVPPSNWPYVKEIVEALESISELDRIPTPVSVKAKAKAKTKKINSHLKKSGRIPLSNPDQPKKPFGKPVIIDPDFKSTKAISKVPDASSEPDHNDSIPAPIPVKDRAKKIASHTKNSDWVPPSNSPSLTERAKNSGWVDCFPGGRCT